MNQKKKFLEIFCGTKSLGIIASKNGFEVYSVDIVKKYEPTKLVDVLEWNYKEDLKKDNFSFVDYVHFSPPCTEFSYALTTRKRDISKGMLLVNKSFEILEYLQSINPKVIWSMENPQGHLMKQPEMKKHKMIMTSYCKYNYPYRKNTCFWYGNIDLKLKSKCKFDCNQLIISNSKNIKDNFTIHKAGVHIKKKSGKNHHSEQKNNPTIQRKIHKAICSDKNRTNNPIVSRKIHKATVNKSQDIIGQGYSDKKDIENIFLLSKNIKLTGRDLRYSIPENLCIDIINQIKTLLNLKGEYKYKKMEAKKISCEKVISSCDKILEISSSESKKKKEKITCECEKIVARGGISRHKKTELHKLLMEKLKEKKQREIEFVKEKLNDQIIRLKRGLEKKKSKKKKLEIEEKISEIEEKIKILTV